MPTTPTMTSALDPTISPELPMADRFSDKQMAVMQATMRLVVVQGIHATPMSQIAKEAGVAAGTIYHYFIGKEELFAVLYGALKEQMGSALLHDDDPRQPYNKRFQRFWRNLYDFFSTHPNEFEFLELCERSPIISAEVRADHARHYQPALNFLNIGIKTRVLCDMPLELMAATIYSSVATTVRFIRQQQHNLLHTNLESTILNTAMQSSWNSIKWF
jgi:TetR/AcrR family transcriptional regulator, multidrug resistance operon repressor